MGLGIGSGSGAIGLGVRPVSKGGLFLCRAK